MTDKWTNIAIYYLSVLLVMNSLFLITDGMFTDPNNRLYGEDVNPILSDIFPNSDGDVGTWFQNNVTNKLISAETGEITTDPFSLFFELLFALGNIVVVMITLFVFIFTGYAQIFGRIASVMGIDTSIATMLTLAVFVMQIFAIFFILTRGREAARL